MAIALFQKHTRADALGMLLSAICMLHCLLLPALIVFGVGGALAGFDNEWTHIVLLTVVVPVSAIAFVGGWIRHRRVTVLALGTLGVALLALAAFVLHPYFGKTADALVTTAGGALLAVAHWRNRDCSCPHDGAPRAAAAGPA
ncbi:MAG: MerC domain-containing protein [Pseudomonadota bacterium]